MDIFLKNSFILLFLFPFLFSCQNAKKESEHTELPTSEPVWIKIPDKIYKNDSTRFILYNNYRTNKKDNELNSQTVAYFSNLDISKKKLEKIAEGGDIKTLKSLNFRGANITEQDSLIFYYKFNNTGKNHLNGFIENLTLLLNKKDSVASLNRTYFKLDFEVLDDSLPRQKK